jgi:uncharacterized protein (UPF0276 family)
MIDTFPFSSLPLAAGIGLRSPHYQQIITEKPPVGWLEVHPENFFVEGGIALQVMEEVSRLYPMSFHGVGLSLGRSDALDINHLKKLKTLVDRYKPAMISEHVSWSAIDGVFINDLLPLPYTEESARVLIDHIKQTQDYLGRQILVENPSSYLDFTASNMPEWEFMNRIAEDSGCGILLDINNIYVMAANHGFDAMEYLNAINDQAVQEIHLAGHAEQEINGQTLLIDHHGTTVKDDVWALYAYFIKQYGAKPTLIEWDTDIPDLQVLLGEAAKAQVILEN